MDCDEHICWICLANNNNEELISVCHCSSLVHQKCLAKWQLHKVGESEEHQCRFCKKSYPDWKDAFRNLPRNTAYFNMSFNRIKYKINVEDRKFDEFKANVRFLFNIHEDQEFNIDYICRIPKDDTKIIIKSIGTNENQYNAAVFLASLNFNLHDNVLDNDNEINENIQDDSIFERSFESTGVFSKILSFFCVHCHL